MYESLLRDHGDLSPLLDGHDPALMHVGDHRRVLRLHERHVAARVAAAGRVDAGEAGDDVPPVGPYLMGRMRAATTLHAACAALARNGPKAPGPGDVRLDELDRLDRWNLCRALGRSLRDGTYQPVASRVIEIPKDGVPGQFRKLTLQSTPDRIVGKAAAMILGPVVEPFFSPFSFGFRPGRDTQSALAGAIALAALQGKRVWVSADVEKAFDRVPFPRFLDVCHRHFPADVVAFVELIAHTGKKVGQRQGSPASPLFFNMFADWFLDGPWHRRRPGQPLFRYADDLLVLCGTVDEAGERHAELSRLAREAGTPLKGTAAGAVVDLGGGGELQWLGYLLRREGNRLAIRVGERAWRRLEWNLAKAHLLDAAPLRAAAIVRGWVNWIGPCFAFENRDATLGRLRDLAAAHAFDELPRRSDLRATWAAAHARWARLCSREAQLLPHRLRVLAEGSAGGPKKGWQV